MAKAENQSNLKLVYRDILNGYSPIEESSFGHIFIKHASVKEDFEAERVYESIYAQYLKDGATTEADRLKALQESGDWTKEDDRNIERLEQFLTKTRKTKNQLVISFQVAQIEEQIRKTESEILDKKAIKLGLLSGTCDGLARQRKEEFLIRSLVFSDCGCKKPLFSKEESEYLSNGEINDLRQVYYSDVVRFSESNLKKVCLHPIFFNFFPLVDTKNSYVFFGTKPTELTFFQQQLAHLGRNVRAILDVTPFSEIPKDVMDDYDRLLVFHENYQNRDNKKRPQNPKRQDNDGEEDKVIDFNAYRDNVIKMLKEKGQDGLSKNDFLDKIG